MRQKVKSQGTSTAVFGAEEAKKRGLLSQYQSRQGVQYYQDLAGNVKQVGLVSETPAFTGWVGGVNHNTNDLST